MLMSRSATFHHQKEIVEQEGWVFWERVPMTESRKREVERWTNVGGNIPNGGRQIHSSSQVPISRINNQGVVKRIRNIADSPTNPDPEGSDELDGE
ncbi:hypothetical protein O181_117722 [Austropuccinia psidii MF-1]|uniref:Uncharacterized protein n=1 Tax=Austropuccinia psidii MF-1 TaxID=1389203 RepID=A0A9Q3KBS9_9BASI|nr:hypothetical protein [Austropuccinia psidii MF-1]